MQCNRKLCPGPGENADGFPKLFGGLLSWRIPSTILRPAAGPREKTEEARLCRFLSVILPVFTLTGTPVSGGGGSVDTAVFDPAQLLELIETRMPFGKYKGSRLIDLPEPYVVWFAGQGFPPGKLGRLLGAVHEIKVNGLEYLFDPLRRF
jgi:hypothetical protein